MMRAFVGGSLLFVLAACGGNPSPGPMAPPTGEPMAHGAEHAAEPSTPAAPEATPTPEGAAMPATPAEPDLMAEERAAYEQAKPVFASYCTKCHTKDGAKAKPKTLAHLDMTTYPFAGEHANELTAVIRKALGLSGKKAVMPKDDPGGVEGAELALIVAWADAYDKAHAAGLHPAVGPAKGHHSDGHKH